VIDHRKGNELDVNASEKRRLRDPFAIDQDQSLFWQEPRRLSCTVPSPPFPMFWLTVPPDSCGINVVRSVALRMPSFSISCGR